jgi:hypothetical protein
MERVDDAVAGLVRSEELERLYREQGARMWRSVLAFAGDPDVASDALAEASTRSTSNTHRPLPAATSPRFPCAARNKSYDRFRFAVLNLDGCLQSDWVPEFRGTIHTGVWDILVTGSQIWIGGGFTTVSGDKRWCLARFTDTP